VSLLRAIPPAASTPEASIIVDRAGEAIVTLDQRDVIRSWNRAAETLFGYSAGEIVGKSFAVLVPSERLAAGELEFLRRQVSEHGVVQGFETERVTKDGRRIKVSATRSELVDGDGRAIGQCCVIRDVSLQRAVIHQLYGSEKLAALRAMAVGLAHELGNPLTGVLSLLQLAERRTDEEATRSRLVQARHELSRLGKIIRELTDFTRADGVRGMIDVNEVLQEALVLARYAHEAAAVGTRLDTDPAVRPLMGSRNHLLQVFLHLLMNAYDAMGEGGGQLTVKSMQIEGQVVLWFEDTGRGIDPEQLGQIFEPFFTTKADGSGLGLFVCQRIVAQEFDGHIEVASEPGVGTRFRIQLPQRLRSAPVGP